MVPTFSMLAAVLIGPGFENTAQSAATERAGLIAVVSAFGTAREAREGVAQALRESNRASGRDPLDTTLSVVVTYRRLSASEELPAAERRRLQAQLGTRLTELHDVLYRRVKRAAASHSRGGIASDAQQLIDLIQATIEPDSWAINGGKGTLYFYSPLNVLVIRQTAEVHEQLGGTLGQLRR
jgi:hypothetical protein